ncbi:N-acetylglucosamine-6-phosphate deacetylase [Pseudooctadecabacter jejudonensis]|uniref:N-acetylglucosamine-6-phosphate deacetylase n=1 Tax=Pseudooctadecabacter jejudonensis TaxID=1391910 RepID=A0A1Y5SDP0_9RHOB|nr:N-acetylglucosamine-6-phosphate deacetylase [Pseudooctadecabacter jejudonensis]SLN38218.1 N-acetylglucosamine-6-phosphate deacetylase [Pseudooctadecabacter jejudonensis]
MTEPYWITADHVFDGETLRPGLGLRIDKGQGVEVGPPPADAQAIPGVIAPGFIDLQVNGGGGVMVNTTPTRDGLATIADAHAKLGTSAILPTVITDGPDVLDRAADAVRTAKTDRRILGLHIEGPHIATAKRGTHHAAFIRPLDARTIEVVSALRADGIAVMITLAPEAATTAQIAELAAMGAVVSIGHTDASASQVNAAIEAGATCATHLYNAMSQMSGRAPGAVGAVLNSHIAAGIICDGHHVDDGMIALALRARPVPDRMFLVSDAMATVGGPNTFALYGQTITVDGGRLINAEGNLAGAHTTMAEGVARLVQSVGVSLEQALRMAITTPARLINQPDRRHLVGQCIQDLQVIHADMTISPLPHTKTG